MSSIDLIVFIGYLLGTLYLSVIFFSKKRTSKSFTLGSGKTPQWVVTLSIFATFVSSISYLALPGSAYGTNWNAFVFSLSIPIAALITVRYFIPVYRRINSSSAYTYMEQRFGPWAKIYVSICYISTQLMRVGTIIYLLALAINMILGWDIITVIVFTGVFVTVYSIIGGIEAVLWTDAIQGIVLILGAVFCVAILLLGMPEGPGQLFEVAIEDHKFSLGDFGGSIIEPTFWVVFVYGIFINLQNFGIDQNYIQLDIVLINPEILEVDEYPIDKNHPEGRFNDGSAKISQAEFMIFNGDFKKLTRPLGHTQKQYGNTKDGTQNQNNSLNGISPQNSLNTSYNRIYGYEHPRKNNYRYNIPTQYHIDGQCQQINDGTHPHQLGGNITNRYIDLGPRAKTLFHISISRRTVDSSVDGNKIAYRDQCRDRNGKAEHKGIPIRSIGTARQSQIADTANKGRKDGKGYYPLGCFSRSQSKRL